MRSIYRTVRMTAVFSIVFMMTVDSANACRLLQLLMPNRGGDCCEPAPAPECCVPATAVESAPVVESAPLAFPVTSTPVEVVSGPIYASPVVSGDSCCGAVPIVDGGVVDDGYVEGGYNVVTEGALVEDDSESVIGETILEPTPVETIVPESTYVPTPSEAGGDVAPVPADSNVIEADPAETASPLDAVGEAPAEETVTDEFGNGGAAVEDASEGFDGAADVPEAPVEESSDDLFSTDPAPADAGGDDIFDAPSDAADPAPADSAFEDLGSDPAPAAGGSDLFDGGDAAPADGGDDLFDGGDAAPVVDGGDDLFDAAPAVNGGDDLFDAGDAAPAVDGGEDLFDAAPAVDGGDDLFDAGDAAPAVDGGDDLFDGGDAPADDLFDGGGDAADADDDLFGQNRVPAGMRVWTDDTGKYKTVGRLVVIAKTHIRLLKSNGRHSTVPLARLSHTDLDFVMGVAKRISSSKRLASL